MQSTDEKRALDLIELQTVMIFNMIATIGQYHDNSGYAVHLVDRCRLVKTRDRLKELVKDDENKKMIYENKESVGKRN